MPRCHTPRGATPPTMPHTPRCHTSRGATHPKVPHTRTQSLCPKICNASYPSCLRRASTHQRTLSGGRFIFKFKPSITLRHTFSTLFSSMISSSQAIISCQKFFDKSRPVEESQQSMAFLKYTTLHIAYLRSTTLIPQIDIAYLKLTFLTPQIDPQHGIPQTDHFHTSNRQLSISHTS